MRSLHAARRPPWGDDEAAPGGGAAVSGDSGRPSLPAAIAVRPKALPGRADGMEDGGRAGRREAPTLGVNGMPPELGPVLAEAPEPGSGAGAGVVAPEAVGTAGGVGEGGMGGPRAARIVAISSRVSSRRACRRPSIETVVLTLPTWRAQVEWAKNQAGEGVIGFERFAAASASFCPGVLAMYLG